MDEVAVLIPCYNEETNNRKSSKRFQKKCCQKQKYMCMIIILKTKQLKLRKKQEL